MARSTAEDEDFCPWTQRPSPNLANQVAAAQPRPPSALSTISIFLAHPRNKQKCKGTARVSTIRRKSRTQRGLANDVVERGAASRRLCLTSPNFLVNVSNLQRKSISLLLNLAEPLLRDQRGAFLEAVAAQLRRSQSWLTALSAASAARSSAAICARRARGFRCEPALSSTADRKRAILIRQRRLSGGCGLPRYRSTRPRDLQHALNLTFDHEGLTREMTVPLSDFGIARRAHRHHISNASRPIATERRVLAAPALAALKDRHSRSHPRGDLAIRIFGP